MSAAADGAVMNSVIARLFDDLNAERIERVRDMFCADATLRVPVRGVVVGRESILAFFKDAFRPFATHVEAPTRVLISGSTATVEMRFEGTTSGGGSLVFEGVDVLDFDDAGLIIALSSWNDSFTVGKQLRALRSAGDGGSA